MNPIWRAFKHSLLPVSLLCVAGWLWQCEDTTSDVSPTYPTNTDIDEYEFSTQAMADAWWILDVFFIFRDDLPSNPDRYANPALLFDATGENWTNYYSYDLAQWYVSMLSTEEGGIGILLESVPAGAVITMVVPNSPGEEAGLLVNDTITAVDGQSTAGIALDTVQSWLAGNIGEVRNLTIGRSTGSVSISVTLGTFLAPSVYVDSLDTATAYIALLSFSTTSIDPEGSSGEFRDALQQTAWAEYLIVDLRQNGGGSVSECLDITAEFVPANSPVVRSREREYVELGDSGRTIDTTWYTGSAGVAQQRKTYVLVDDNTASASEILLSCLREQRSDIVSVGTTTYGKARSQYVIGYDFDTEEYFLADRGLATVTFSVLSPITSETYDLVGITPDYETATSAAALDQAITLIRQDQGGPLPKQAALDRKSAYLDGVRRVLRTRQWRPLAVYDVH